VLGLCGFVLLLLFSTQVGSARTQSTVKQIGAPVWTLAMDWPRVAYASGQDRKSESIRVWNVATGATSAVDGGRSTDAVQYAGGLLLSGTRVVWIRAQQIGNTNLDYRLYSAPVGGSAHLLKAMHGLTGIYCDKGPALGGLAGSRSAVVVSTWDAGPDGTKPSKQRLALVGPSALSTVATGAKAIVSQSVDGGHIAVLPLPTFSFTYDNGCNYATLPANVLVYSTTGALLAKVPLPPRDPTTDPGGYQVAIRGNRLVVLARGLHEPSGPAWVTLSVYDWTKPKYKRLHTWPVAIPLYPGEANFSFYGHVAAVEGYSDLHLVNLDTGKDVVIAPSSQTGCSTALGPQGLVYALNSYTAGQLVFVPMAKLLQLVS